MTQRFEGTSSYIATEDLKVAVNAAVTLRRPLLVKGEPGTGKTVLAHEIAKAVNAPLIEWNVKSTTKAQQGLYEYDAVARLRDGQLGDPSMCPRCLRTLILPSIPTSSDAIGPPPHSGRTREAPTDLACVPNWPGCPNSVAIGRWPNEADSSRSPKS